MWYMLMCGMNRLGCILEDGKSIFQKLGMEANVGGTWWRRRTGDPREDRLTSIFLYDVFNGH